MSRRFILHVCAAVAATALLAACSGTGPGAGAKPMSFFITSANPGKGADFGGLAGADRYCQALATDVGAGSRAWRAYLSDAALPGQTAVNARDRIGAGPWRNAKGVVVASSVAELHANNNLNKQTALTQNGEPISGRGDAVNMHDVLTGSRPDGTAFPVEAGKDTTCGNWTRSGDGSAIVGHHDRTGLDEQPPAKSWNSSHATRGCGMDALKATGGAGLLYCFAAN